MFMGFASLDSTNCRSKIVFSVHSWESKVQRADCVHCSAPFYIRDSSIHKFWYPRVGGLKNQFPPNTKIQRYQFQTINSFYHFNGPWNPWGSNFIEAESLGNVVLTLKNKPSYKHPENCTFVWSYTQQHWRWQKVVLGSDVQTKQNKEPSKFSCEFNPGWKWQCMSTF